MYQLTHCEISRQLGGGNLKAKTHKSELRLDFSPFQKKGRAGKKESGGTIENIVLG